MKEQKAEREYEAYSRNVTERDVSDVVEKEKSILTKVKGPLKRFSEDITLFFSIINDYVHGTYREIPWTGIAGIVGTLLYVLIPTDVIPDGIPFLGLTDDASVVLFCLKSLDAELQKYKTWKNAQPKIPEQRTMEVTVTLRNVDYAALTERFLPMVFNSVEKKEKKSFKDKLLLLFKKPANSVAPKIVGKLNKEKIDEATLKYVNENKDKIIVALQHEAEKNKVPVTIADIEITNGERKDTYARK